ncbi:hypothetical protein C8R46DRAFT_1104106, partial [Mycena filopes]
IPHLRAPPSVIIPHKAHRRVAELQQAIDKLTEERVAVCTYMDAHKALVSPARRLPVDIIPEIFMACLPTDRNCVMSARRRLFCSGASTIFLSIPRLWSSRLHNIAEPAS